MPKISIPFGPYHPALGEPEYFQVVTEGEIIKMVDFELGYNYREIEKKALTFAWPKAISFLGRICGICSSAHTQAFTLAMEKINSIEIPRKASWLRVFGAELERISSHLLWLGLMGEMAGFEPLFYLSWGAREHVLNIMERFGGKRVQYSYMTYGGVLHSIKDRNFVGRELAELRKKYGEVKAMVVSNEGLASRFKGVGKISQQDVKDYGLVGPTARGSGVDMDTRKDMPYLAYEDLGFTTRVHNGGDTYSRLMVRLDEVDESISLAETIVNELPGGRLKSIEKFYKSKEGEASQAVEAPCGENFHYVVAGKLMLKFIRVRPPTFANLSVVPKMLKGMTVSDVPVIISSIDPCFACTDRVILVDEKSRTVREVQM